MRFFFAFSGLMSVMAIYRQPSVYALAISSPFIDLVLSCT
jgi:hypothetical protein